MVKILGILGWPVSHTLSPVMHNHAIKKLGLNYQYLSFAVPPEKLSSAIEGVRGLDFAGVNLTIPHKEAVVPLLDYLDPEARQIGAVNTVSVRDGKLFGYNTDGQGFLKSVTEELSIEVTDKRILIIGAGGAARGVAVTLLKNKISCLVIANRSVEKGELLKDYLTGILPLKIQIKVIKLSEISPDILESVDMVINTTSVGMAHNDSYLFNYDLITDRHIICDIIYSPFKTRLLHTAEKKRALNINGLGMLIHQGALAFKIWTGEEMPVSSVRDILQEALNRKNNG